MNNNFSAMRQALMNLTSSANTQLPGVTANGSTYKPPQLSTLLSSPTQYQNMTPEQTLMGMGATPASIGAGLRQAFGQGIKSNQLPLGVQQYIQGLINGALNNLRGQGYSKPGAQPLPTYPFPISQ